MEGNLKKENGARLWIALYSCVESEHFFSNHLLFKFTVCICMVQEKQVTPVAATNIMSHGLAYSWVA